MPKRICILIEKLFEDSEFIFPFYRMKEEGYEVIVVGSGTSKTYEGKYGNPVTIDKDISGVLSATFDAVIIPGGFCPDYLRRSPAVVKFVQEMLDNGKIVAAICHGPALLCSTYRLKGRTATSFFAIKDDVINAGAHWVDQEVVIDQNLITSRHPPDMPKFCSAIIYALNHKD